MDLEKENHLFKTLLQSFGELPVIMEKVCEMQAIWLDKPVLLPNGNKHSRIETGMKITVVNGKIVNSKMFVKGTHKVLGCYGKMDSSRLSMKILDLKTGLTEILTLK